MTYTFNNFNHKNFAELNRDFRGTLRDGNDLVLSCDPEDIGVAADVLGSNEDILKSQKAEKIGAMTLVKNAWAYTSGEQHGYGDYDRHAVLKALEAGDSVTLFSRC